MNKEMIIRAWKDPVYRASLSPEQRAAIPESPSGIPLNEVDESELDGVVGGRPPLTYPICFTEPKTVYKCPTGQIYISACYCPTQPVTTIF
ncbi:mersacidin/lichenicidin family type 2 lantibiotic [Archangium gephyra]|uniref:mersacidin/lichenicidin family type 2 lantibiotic n=1 Tax=Archangium gephyra TaxID=48 RepID=UPI0035D4EF8A